MRFPFWLAAALSGLNAALYVEHGSSTTLGIAVFFGLLAVAPAGVKTEDELEQAEIDPRLAVVMILVGFLICAAAVVTLLR